MSKLRDNDWVAGVDGCRGGWVVALGRLDGETLEPRFASSINEIVRGDKKPKIVAIDVPIGIPTFSPVGGRKCEPDLRKLLRGKANSVFRVPCREAIYAGVDKFDNVDRGKFKAAYKIACKNSEDKKGFPLQSLFIFDKIIQVDRYLRSGAGTDAKKIYETHPELAFYYMNQCAPVLASKKSKEGFECRRELLLHQKIPSTVIDKWPNEAKRDDNVDALACLVTARKIAGGHQKCHPASPCTDDCGLQMAIWA